MLIQGIMRAATGILLASMMGSCSLLQRNQAGSSPDNPILLDTMELNFFSQEPEMPERGAAPRKVDVLHTTLHLEFDLPEKTVFGTAWLRLTPYFDPLDSVVLDARGFDFKLVGIAEDNSTTALEYIYDGNEITILLDAALERGEEVTLVMEYVAKPADLPKGEGQAISSSQGLYFINPKADSNSIKPQVWSQGETEYNSGWFPCVDQPNEKQTQEIMLTVDTSMVTLSNGRLLYSIDNGDGTRSDVWKQELPHSTYLTMIAVGDFAIVKDTWRGKDVWYYVDPEFEVHARKIFGHTPEMLEFYSELLGYPYPWEKFHQVIVHDFVSGAMENTSAVVHGEFVQQTPRQMIDETHEDVIAHELFHHWFGDLVTSESWTQITMNEGFATYGEYLWWQHKYGEEEARLHLQTDLDAYLAESNSGTNHALIRRRYNDPDEVFDRHSYQKGGRVLHMLRNELGDELFFAGLKHYLQENAFGCVEEVHLRLAMEAVSGRDLQWFFNQWYAREGHPVVAVEYTQNIAPGAVTVDLTQQSEHFGTFKFHVDLVLGKGDTVITKRLWVDEEEESFALNLDFIPEWYAIDPKGDMLWEVREQKTIAAWMAQFEDAPHVMTRLKSFDVANQLSAKYKERFAAALIETLGDPEAHWSVKKAAATRVVGAVGLDTNAAVNALLRAFQEGHNTKLRAQALLSIDSLSKEDEGMTDLFIGAMRDSSMRVVRSALGILTERDPCSAIGLSQSLSDEDGEEMLLWISRMHALCGNEASLTFFTDRGTATKGIDRFMFNNDFTRFAQAVQSEKVFDALVKYLGESAFEEMTWWERMSAMQGLERAIEFYSLKLEGFEQMASPSEEDLTRLALLRNKKANLAALISEAKELEAEAQEGSSH
ncbi:MAG: M1 family metallopeptidase [Cryomorphaceae bacterium]